LGKFGKKYLKLEKFQNSKFGFLKNHGKKSTTKLKRQRISSRIPSNIVQTFFIENKERKREMLFLFGVFLWSSSEQQHNYYCANNGDCSNYGND
jgi:hypothetical protein